MDAYAANKLYEYTKKHIADKLVILDIALRAIRDAAKEAYEKNLLEGSYYDLEDFRGRQEQLIFKEVMDMNVFEVEKISEGTS